MNRYRFPGVRSMGLLAAAVLLGCSSCSNESDPSDQPSSFVRIEPGTFVLGSPPEQLCRYAHETQVEVALTRPFLMSKRETTQAEWERFFHNPVPSPDPDMPITYVTQWEAMAYCNELSKAEGLTPCYNLSNCVGIIGTGCPEGEEYELGCSIILAGEGDPLPNNYRCDYDVHVNEDWYACDGYRLPTAAEWEYAARAGTTTSTYNGEVMVDTTNGCEYDPVMEPIGWYCHNAKDQVQRGGQLQPNAYGLFDMLGNVYEWADNVYTGYSMEHNCGQAGPLTDPRGRMPDSEADTRRSAMGGAARRASCRCAASNHWPMDGFSRGYDLGFRPVRTVE